MLMEKKSKHLARLDMRVNNARDRSRSKTRSVERKPVSKGGGLRAALSTIQSTTVTSRALGRAVASVNQSVTNTIDYGKVEAPRTLHNEYESMTAVSSSRMSFGPSAPLVKKAVRDQSRSQNASSLSVRRSGSITNIKKSSVHVALRNRLPPSTKS